MSQVCLHKIIQKIKKNSAEYLCENHDGKTVSYPNFKSLKEDHPDIEDIMIVKCDLRTINAIRDKQLKELEQRMKIACNNDNSHTKKLSEEN